MQMRSAMVALLALLVPAATHASLHLDCEPTVKVRKVVPLLPKHLRFGHDVAVEVEVTSEDSCVSRPTDPRVISFKAPDHPSKYCAGAILRFSYGYSDVLTSEGASSGEGWRFLEVVRRRRCP